MNKAEAAKVVAILKATWSNHPFTPESPHAYWLGLQDLEFADVEVAIARAIQTETFCPVPATLRNILGANAATEPDPEAAWGEVQNQIRIMGYYRAPRFTDPAIAEAVQIMGWQTLCTADLADEPANRKHFWDVYRSCKRRENQQAVREAASGITPIGGKSTKQIAS
jgi:hypothetical protein